MTELQILRERIGWSQRQLAERLGWTSATPVRLMEGGDKPVDDDLIRRLQLVVAVIEHQFPG